MGKGGDYASLDALVMDATNNPIEDPGISGRPRPCGDCGTSATGGQVFSHRQAEQDNSEMLAADVIISQKRIGNLPAVRVPYFPADAIPSQSWKTCPSTTWMTAIAA